MKNLFIVSALMFGFIQAIVAAPSKAEAEVAIAFEKYFDARANQNWDTVASMESASEHIIQIRMAAFIKPYLKQLLLSGKPVVRQAL